MKTRILTLALTFVFGAAISLAADKPAVCDAPAAGKCGTCATEKCACKKGEKCACEKGKCACGKAAAACPADASGKKADKKAERKADKKVKKPDATSDAIPAGYPLTTCVVSGEPLGSMGKAYVYQYKQDNKPDQTVVFCCKACVPKFEKDPAKYLALIAAASKK